MASETHPKSTNARPRTPEHEEAANLRQKLRLRYLLRTYAPSSLTTNELFKRLKDRPPEKKLAAKSIGPRSRPLTDEGIRDLLPSLKHPNDLRFTIETDSSEARRTKSYYPTKALTSALCDGLGWIIADAFEHWSSNTDEEFNRRRQEIATYIHEGKGQPVEIFLGANPNWLVELTEELNQRQASQDRQREYLRGDSPAAWNNTGLQTTIERRCEDAILGEILEGERRVILVTSAAGDGKTTLLHRLARRLFSADGDPWRILFKSERHRDEVPNFAVPADGSCRTALFYDRADGLKDLDALHSWVSRNPSVHVVLAAREVDWRMRYSLDNPHHTHISINRLDSGEVDTLANLLFEYQAAPTFTTRDQLGERLKTSVTSTSYPHMLAAVMTACNDAQFEEILGALVSRFPYQHLLRWISLCAATVVFGNSGLARQQGFANSYLMSALYKTKYKRDSLDSGKAKFKAERDKVSAEVIQIYGDRFDLRHPDIARFVLKNLYHADDEGALRSTAELENDLFDIISAAVSVMLDHDIRVSRNVTGEYLRSLPHFWWNSPIEPTKWVGRHLYADLCEIVANSFLWRDKTFAAALLDDWMSMEEHVRSHDNQADEILNRWLPEYVFRAHEGFIELISRGPAPNNELIYASAERLVRAYTTYVHFLWQNDNIGKFSDPAAGTARFALREFWGILDRNLDLFLSKKQTIQRVQGLLVKWIDIEGGRKSGQDTHAIDVNSNASKFSIRWIFEQIWSDRLFEAVCSSEIVRRQAFWEEKSNGGAPVQQDAERSVFRRFWASKEHACDAEFMRSWARFEFRSNPGKDDGSDLFSGRWVFRQAASDVNRTRLCSDQLVADWARCEKGMRNYGVLRGICSLVSPSSAAILTTLAIIKLVETPGDFDDPEPGTGRYELRSQYDSGAPVDMEGWATWEEYADESSSHVGKKYSADWIRERLRERQLAKDPGRSVEPNGTSQ